MLLRFAAAAGLLAFAPAAFAGAPAPIDGAIKAFFAKHAKNGAIAMMDSATGTERPVSLPAAPARVYRAEKFYVVSYVAGDANTGNFPLDIFVSGIDDNPRVSLVYVSYPQAVTDLVAKGSVTLVP